MNDEAQIKRVGKIRVGGHDEPGAIYIGKDSPLGNPFPMKNQSEAERTRVISEYAKWLDDQIRYENPEVRKALGGIYIEVVRNGKDVVLGCCCSSKRCHGNIIADHIRTQIALSIKHYPRV